MSREQLERIVRRQVEQAMEPAARLTGAGQRRIDLSVTVIMANVEAYAAAIAEAPAAE